MAHSMKVIFLRIMAICFLLAVLYVMGVFLFPDVADTYGHSELNAKIRNIKNAAFELSDSSGNLQFPL